MSHPNQRALGGVCRQAFADAIDATDLDGRWEVVAAHAITWCQNNVPSCAITPGYRPVPAQPFDVGAATTALAKLTDAMDSLPREDKGKAKEALAHAMATVADSIRVFYTTSHTVTKPA